MTIKTKFKKSICWITPDYFFCVDSFIVPKLSNDYEIHWILINTKNTKRKIDGLVSETFKPMEYNLAFRQRDPRIILQYLKLLKGIRKCNTDLIYISFHGLPFFFPLFFLLIDAKKVIYGAHNVTTPKGASNEFLMKIYNKYVYKKTRNFQVFSKNQLTIIKNLFPNKQCYYAPLALEDYGPSNLMPPDDVIRFLSFGYIRKYKRLDLLLTSFQHLYGSGIKNIELIIAGTCDHWQHYHPMIKYSEAIKTRIEVIPNAEIADLISSCHYMVLPYQDCAQSAVLTLAYQYNKPIIASDIEAFKEFIIEGTTGFFFKSNSMESLYLVMEKVISNHKTHYPGLTDNISSFVKKNYEISQILSKYKSFLNECISRNSTDKY